MDVILRRSLWIEEIVRKYSVMKRIISATVYIFHSDSDLIFFLFEKTLKVLLFYWRAGNDKRISVSVR